MSFLFIGGFTFSRIQPWSGHGFSLPPQSAAAADPEVAGAAEADAGAEADGSGFGAATRGAEASGAAEDVAGGVPVGSVLSQAAVSAARATAERRDKARFIGKRSLPQTGRRVIVPLGMRATIVETIAAKRDGLTLTAEEIKGFLRAFGEKKVEDYQMTAFLMAVFFRGLDDAETVALTEAMLHSGTVLDLSSVPGVKVDKHSTGGVGDKVSICLAPLVAACGVPVPMVSGRGLGHTGGTLDKLEAIPGFRTDLSITDFARIVKDHGTCMIGQTAEIAPADKRIYALRDVTATVESIPLIVASILSKKLAEGIDGLVLDVKVGKGAFMKDQKSARALAEKLVSVGTRAGKNVVAVLTRMDAPLGRAIGNANETREALEVLHGKGPADLVECTMVLGAEMLVVGKKATDIAEARSKLQAAIANGDAIRTMEKMVAAQSGDASVVAHPEKLAVAKTVVEVKATQSGYVTGIDALTLGLAGVAMGAGRTRAADKVDPAVGIEIDRKPGEAVKSGDVVARVFLHAENAALVDRVQSAFTYGEVAPPAEPLVVERITTG